MKKSRDELYSYYIDTVARLFHENNMDFDLLKEAYLPVIQGAEKIEPTQLKREPYVYIFAHQLLSYNHAATKIAIDLAIFLLERYNKVIFVINPPAIQGQYLTFNQVYQKIGVNEIQGIHFEKGIARKNIDILFLPGCDHELEVDERDLLFSIGSGVFIFERILSKKKVVLPTVNINPVTTSIFFTSLAENKKNKWTNIYGDKLKKIEIGFLLDKRLYTKKTLSKAEELIRKKTLGIEKNRFDICISGNRLDKDLSKKENIALLNKLCEMDAVKIHLLDGGGTLNEDFKIKLPDNIRYHSYQHDLKSFYACFDCILNIYREGNGTQSIIALAQEVLMLSPPGNDFSLSVPDSMIFNDDQELLEALSRLVSNEKYRQKMHSDIINLKEKLNRELIGNIESSKSSIDKIFYSDDLSKIVRENA